MGKNDSGKDWGIAVAMLFIAIALPTVLYILFSMAYGSPWPHEWNKKDSYWFLLFVVSIVPLLSAKYLVLHNEIDVKKWIYKMLDIDESKDKKPLEAILSHYTNMASAGLLLAILTFTLKPFVESQSIYLVGLPLAFLTILIFFLYGALVLKPVVCLIKYPFYVALPVTLIVIGIDIQGFKLFISSVPK